MANTIALVDDDRNILTSVSIALEAEGFLVRCYSDGAEAIKGLNAHGVDLAVLDIKMPRMDGMELLQKLRQRSSMPVIFLTSKDEEVDELMGLRLGADDYITKPFSMRELMARINAVLRRARRPDADRPVYDDGTLVINPSTFSVRCRGRDVRLTRKEFALLEELARNAGRVLTRESLLDRVWGHNYYGDSRTLDVHIRRLRQKLDSPEMIETVTGIGYRLQRAAAGEEP